MTFESIVDAVRAYLGLEPNHPIAVNLVRPHPIERDVHFVVAVAPIDTPYQGLAQMPKLDPLPPAPEPLRVSRAWPKEKSVIFSEITKPKKAKARKAAAKRGRPPGKRKRATGLRKK